MGIRYLVVRGEGTAPTLQQIQQDFGSEQTTIVATKDNTIINIQNFNPNGTVSELPGMAGDSYTFSHDNGIDLFSSSLITTENPVIVY